jgi:hypothetical protein
MLTLLQEAGKVPVIVASLTNTGHVLLEVGTDLFIRSVCIVM